MIEVKASLISGAAFAAAMERAVLNAEEWAAREWVRMWCEAVGSGRRPAGGAQKAVQPATLKKPGRQGSVALVDTGRMSSTSAWRVVLQRNTVTILAPPDRVDVLGWLDAEGFYVYETPDGWDERFAARLQAEITEAGGRL